MGNWKFALVITIVNTCNSCYNIDKQVSRIHKIENF